MRCVPLEPHRAVVLVNDDGYRLIGDFPIVGILKIVVDLAIPVGPGDRHALHRARKEEHVAMPFSFIRIIRIPFNQSFISQAELRVYALDDLYRPITADGIDRSHGGQIAQLITCQAPALKLKLSIPQLPFRVMVFDEGKKRFFSGRVLFQRGYCPEGWVGRGTVDDPLPEVIQAVRQVTV